MEPIGLAILIGAGLGELITGHVFESSIKPRFSSDAPPALEARGLTCAGQYADINFEVRPGEILGLTGRLGSGRTELALSLFGMNPPDSGEIRVNGERMVFATIARRSAKASPTFPKIVFHLGW